MTAQRARTTRFRNTIKTFTMAERLQTAIGALKTFGKGTLPSLTEVERTHPDMLDRLSTNDTILAPIITAFNEVGDLTEPTVGAVRAKLELSQNDVDYLFCYCHNGTEMSGEEAATRLTVFAAA